MRVTLISGEYPPMRGGVADYTALLARGLTRFGVETMVLTSTRAVGTLTTTSPTVFPWVKSWGVGLWRSVAEHIAEVHPDIIHVQYQTGAFEMKLGINALPWVNLLRRHRPRIVVTFHDLKEPFLLPKIGSARHLATHLLAFGADGIIATNAEDFARLAGRPDGSRTSWRWGRRQLRAIPIGSNIPSQPPDGYDRAAWRERLGVREGEILLAYFGFLNPSKGVETLVVAFEMLVQRGSPVRLLMVGASAGANPGSDRRYENRLRQRLDESSARGRVGWTGFAEASDIAAHLRSADICVLPFRDGVSSRHGTLIAAIAHHLPIISTRPRLATAASAFPSLRAEENALLVPPDDPAALSEAIRRVVESPALREQLSRGSAAIADAFQWDTIARHTLRLYQELCQVV